MKVRLISVTKPVAEDLAAFDAEDLVAYCARVSNPANQLNTATADKLIRYLIKHKHWSPLQMVDATVEIETTRDIGRQILRHQSFSFQEFCVSGDTLITLELPNGVASGNRQVYKRSIEHLFRLQQSGRLPCFARVFDEASRTFISKPIKEVFQTGVKPVFKITLDNGKTITATKEHKFLTQGGFQSLEDAIGLSTVGNRAVMTKPAVLGCNGVSTYTDAKWLSSAKGASIKSGQGLQGIAEAAGVTTHTIRKWLRHHNLQFTKHEVASYTPIWNKGVRGYSLPRHRLETIEKMRRSARRGAASNLWRGGADRSERLKITDWCNAHRSEFLRGANYSCVCGSSKDLELHHVKSVASAPELAYEKTNIQVLCRECHTKTHSLSGERNTWREKSRGNTLTVRWSKVVKVEYMGEVMTYDMEVDHESHNYVANGIVTHNSQRYAEAQVFAIRELRMQDTNNRQNSISSDDLQLAEWWENAQQAVIALAETTYRTALASGVAKEVARAVLPEGMTVSRMYMKGSLRSWIHYLDVREGPETQKEHRLIAHAIAEAIVKVFPATMKARRDEKVKIAVETTYGTAESDKLPSVLVRPFTILKGEDEE